AGRSRASRAAATPARSPSGCAGPGRPSAPPRTPGWRGSTSRWGLPTNRPATKCRTRFPCRSRVRSWLTLRPVGGGTGVGKFGAGKCGVGALVVDDLHVDDAARRAPRDAGPLVGVVGVGQILVLGELLADGLQQMRLRDAVRFAVDDV